MIFEIWLDSDRMPPRVATPKPSFRAHYASLIVASLPPPPPSPSLRYYLYGRHHAAWRERSPAITRSCDYRRPRHAVARHSRPPSAAFLLPRMWPASNAARKEVPPRTEQLPITRQTSPPAADAIMLPRRLSDIPYGYRLSPVVRICSQIGMKGLRRCVVLCHERQWSVTISGMPTVATSRLPIPPSPGKAASQ